MHIDTINFLTLWGLYLIASFMTAVWVFVDGGRRGLGVSGSGARFGWALLTFLVLPFALPVYLLIGRPAGELAICPTCQASVLRYRTTCWHCGSPLNFGGPPAIWGTGDVVGVVIVLILFLTMVFDVTALFGEVMSSFGALSLLLVAQNGLLILLAVYVVQVRYGQPLTALGIRWTSGFAQVGKGVLVGLIALPLSAVAEIAERLVIAAFIGPARADVLAATEQSRNHLLALLKEPLAPREIAWLAVLVCVLVPIGEEIFFRGFLYGALRARVRLPLAVGLSALIFAFVHLPAIFTFLPILVLGAVLALLYERTGTLLPGIIVHSINNAIAILAALAGWNV